MALIDLVWKDFADAKYGDEYMILYTSKHQGVRKALKFIILICSSVGVFTAFKEAKAPTIILCIATCVAQLLSVVESSIICSEKEIDEFRKLRLLYCNYTAGLERLFYCLFEETTTIEDGTAEYHRLKDHKNLVIEPADTALDIKRDKKLMDIAETNTANYLKRYA